MRDVLRIFVLLFFGLSKVAQGQTVPSAPSPAVPILLEAALPVYPPIAKVAHVTGKVIVRATITNGMIVATTVLSKLDPSGQRFLETPTLENLKTWRFSPEVTGVFTVTYTYEVSGEETENPTNAKIEMLPSLDVRITARPLKPTCMDCGAPPVKVLPHRSGNAANHKAGHGGWPTTDPLVLGCPTSRF